jgi:hypothetical protein
LIPFTSLIILLEIMPRTSYGSLAQSAVIPSTLFTALTVRRVRPTHFTDPVNCVDPVELSPLTKFFY